MARLVGMLVTAVVVFACGMGAGAGVARHTDPLRQDSPPMRRWLELNAVRDTSAMYDVSSAWVRGRMTREQFVETYSIPTPRDPSLPLPTFTLVASVPMPIDGIREDFYLVQRPGDPSSAVMITCYVDDQGRFMMFAIA